ncbi:MAG TPA: iron-containing alcohol dehydrogenase, partial [Herpetosiphonaceae bacterium]|nr:iron-containing alcohol dehydrogenase [Herpetosiphonaceae bacterium]
AAPLGGMFPAPHGTICARLLPLVMAANVQALQERAPDAPALARYGEIARILTRDPGAGPRDGVAWVQDLCAELGVPSLASYGVALGDISEVVAKARQASSMRGNPIELTPDELARILDRAIGADA